MTARIIGRKTARQSPFNGLLAAVLLAALAAWGCAPAAGGPDGGTEPSDADPTIAKGGDDRTGPYDPVPGWWKPAPNHDDEWGWGQ
ncbi:MAG: hypothetical protein F4106_03620, partial [Gemmatimonadetes bacterium]|nr:hypothetical protein [Gemmatimonadota bacterium]